MKKKKETSNKKSFILIFLLMIVVGSIWGVIFTLFYNGKLGSVKKHDGVYKDTNGDLVIKNPYDGTEMRFDKDSYSEVEVDEIPDYTVSENTMQEWEDTEADKMEDIINYLTDKTDTIDYTGFDVDEGTIELIDNIKKYKKDLKIDDTYTIENNETIYVNKITVYDLVDGEIPFRLQILKFHNSEYMIDLSFTNVEFEERFLGETVDNETKNSIIESEFSGALESYFREAASSYTSIVKNKCLNKDSWNKLKEIKDSINSSDNKFDTKINDDGTMKITIYKLNDNGLTFDEKESYTVSFEYNDKEREYNIKGVK